MSATKDYSRLHSWEIYSRSLMTEYRQLTEEGYDIEYLKPAFDAVAKLPDSDEREEMADALFRLAASSPTDPNYKYTEPSDYEGISAARDGKAPAKVAVAPASIRDKIRGAWYGRIAGCLLGKPLEGIRTEELIPVLQKTNNYPLHRYLTRAELTEEICAGMRFGLIFRDCFPDLIPNAPVDDDTNYTALYMKLFERLGRDFTPADIARWWLIMQPKNAYCTAERVAYVNFTDNVLPPASASYHNAYREWIGAQIRADFFGYVCPGDPEAAAELAWRDACISHVKNGIYGEMFVAAALARAAVSEDVVDVLRSGLSQIPKQSRLYERVKALIDGFLNGMTAEAAFSSIARRWNEHMGHDWCHTISNAEIVTASLLWYGDDYGHAICRAVQSGFDTDCNGATVGSIWGMMHGFDAIGKEWIEPLHGKLSTSIRGTSLIDIEEAVDDTIRLATV